MTAPCPILHGPAALASAIATVRNHWAEPERYSAVYLPALELIARHHLALLDAGELVRVRGLEWESYCDLPTANYYARTPDGVSYRANYEGWSCHGKFTRTDSLESAKLAAESHYRSRLAAALEPLLPEVRK